MFGKTESGALARDRVEERVSSLISAMTFKEKVGLLNGNWDIVRNSAKYSNPYNPTPIRTNGLKRLSISPVAFTDGPRGVVMGHSTCFPVSMARGASFDRALEREIGNVIGIESRAQGANLFAGVCINLLRHPAWGRAQETYGEDPYLVGEMGAALTVGVQAHNVMACIKHYAVNSIENSRFFVNIEADERTMREVYLPHFKKCIAAGAAAVMGAYNKFQGDHCCESRRLLTQILRDDWGFEGFTISDFIFGVRDLKKAIEAGLDIEMPMPIKYGRHLLAAVKDRRIAEDTVDTAVRRVLTTLTVFESDADPQKYSPGMIASQAHRDLARRAAEESMVLIKNEDQVLPFNRDVKSILVVGSLAKKENTGDHGSSRIYAPYVITPLEGISHYLGDDVTVEYCDETEIERAAILARKVDCVVIAAGNDFNDEGEFISPDSGGLDMGDLIHQGTRNQGMPLKAFFIRRMMKKLADSYTSEDGTAAGGDRSSLSLKSREITMIQDLGRINPRTVVILVGGSMIMTDAWDDKVPAVLYSWYAGMEGGNALPRVLFGDVSPSGKLPFTIPRSEMDLPYFSSTDESITYDGFHGYSLLDKQGVEAAYPFGHGLSYTTFSYSDLALDFRDAAIQVSVTVENTGDYDAKEVVQVYAGLPGSTVDRAPRLLKGFEKIFILSGDRQRLTISVPTDELRYFNEALHSWKLEEGTYRLFVGGSSHPSRLLFGDITIEGDV